MSLRRLRNLVAGLPRDSAFFVSAHPEAARWSQTDELVATLIEVTDRVHLRHLRALGATQLPKGIVIPRPQSPAAPAPKRKATSEDLKRIFGGAVRYVPPKEVSADA